MIGSRDDDPRGQQDPGSDQYHPNPQPLAASLDLEPHTVGRDQIDHHQRPQQPAARKIEAARYLRPAGKKRRWEKQLQINPGDQGPEILVNHLPDILFNLRQGTGKDQHNRQGKQCDSKLQRGQGHHNLVHGQPVARGCGGRVRQGDAGGPRVHPSTAIHGSLRQRGRKNLRIGQKPEIVRAPALPDRRHPSA